VAPIIKETAEYRGIGLACALNRTALLADRLYLTTLPRLAALRDYRLRRRLCVDIGLPALIGGPGSSRTAKGGRRSIGNTRRRVSPVEDHAVAGLDVADGRTHEAHRARAL